MSSAVVTTEHVRAELVAHAPLGVVPGGEVWVGLSLEHIPHWHTYWKNPGDSGLPTSLAWQLPTGVSAGEIAWPTPQAIRVGPLVNYGYEGKLLLPVPLEIHAGFSGASLPLRLHAEWLVCEKTCIPESGDFVLDLPVTTPSIAHADLFIATRARMPYEAQAVQSITRVAGDTLVVEVDGLPEAFQGAALSFLPETGGVIDHAAPVAQRVAGGVWQARVPLSPQRSESPGLLAAVLLAPGQDAGLRVTLPVSWSDPAAVNSAPAAAVATHAPAPGAAFDRGVWIVPGLVVLGLLVAWAWNKLQR